MNFQFFFQFFQLIFLEIFLFLSISFAKNLNNSQKSSAEITTMNICSIIERGNSLLIADYDRIGPAIDLALRAVNEDILPDNIKFTLSYKDGGSVCAPKSSTIGRLMEWAAAGVKCNLFLGPGCSEAVLDLYQAAEHDNIILMGIPGAHTSSRSGLPRSSFPNLIRTTYTFVDLGRAVTKFMDLFNYSHITIITNTESYFYQEMGDNFRSQYRNQRQNLRKITTFVDFTHDQMPPSWTTNMLYSGLLRDANLTSRVILLFANATVVRNFMVAASDLGMSNGEFVFLCVELFTSKIWGEFTWQNGEIHDRKARQAFQSLLVFSMAEVIGPAFDEFSRIFRNYALRQYNYSMLGSFERIDPVTMAYVEAVFLVGHAVRGASDAGQNFTDTSTLLEKMRNVTVKSDLQNDITIGANGDRVILYDIKSFAQASPYPHSVLRMDFVNKQFTWLATLQWPSRNGEYVNVLPPDVPVCGLSGLECSHEKTTTLVVTASVIPVILLVVASVVVAFIYQKMRLDQDPNWWRFHTKDLEFPEHARLTSLLGSSYTVDTNKASERNTMFTSRLLTVSPWRSATLQGNQIAVVPLPQDTFRVTEGLMTDLKMLRYLRHQNIQRFIGLAIDDHSWITHIIGEMCAKGCLQDILENMSFKMDWSFRFSFMKDIAQGLAHLHLSTIHSHGFLTSMSCLIDGRFVVKIGDSGLAKFHNASEREPPEADEENEYEKDFYFFLWRSPEQLRVTMSEKGSQKGDVYSFAIIVQQIILRSHPFSQTSAQGTRTNRAVKELLLEVARGVIPPVRPPVPRSACSVELYDLMESCWSEFPMDRPSMEKVQSSIRKISGLSGDNVIDTLLNRMEGYSQELESQIADQSLLLTEERHRLEELMTHLLPRNVAQKLSAGQVDQPRYCSSVTVYNAKLDLSKNKTFRPEATAQQEATTTIILLSQILEIFDHLVDLHGLVWRPLVSPGNYMIVCGLEGGTDEETNHAVEIVKISVELNEQFILIPQMSFEKVTIHVGIHSGPCVAGIFGMKPPRYCLFGETVLFSAKLKHLAEPGKIVISETTRTLLGKNFDSSSLKLSVRGPVESIGTYWLSSNDASN